MRTRPYLCGRSTAPGGGNGAPTRKAHMQRNDQRRGLWITPIKPLCYPRVKLQSRTSYSPWVHTYMVASNF